MKRILIIPLIVFALSVSIPSTVCFAQFSISGRILNGADLKPIANASVFLNNATIGSKSAADGSFTLHNISPGKYDLIISDVEFETYNQSVVVVNTNIILPDISLQSRTIGLKEVKIKFKTDPNRERNYEWFKNEFLGASAFAQECKILNPDVIDLDYDENAKILTASSYDFIEIENDALGYKIKYLLTDFLLDDKDPDKKKIYYKGAVSMEELQGTASQERHWKANRQGVYENSPMHFLRSALADQLGNDGFRVLKYAIYANPERPADDLINGKIKYYKSITSADAGQRDSLSFWIRKSKLEKTVKKLLSSPLSQKDIINSTDKQGQYNLICDSGGLYVAFNKRHRFHINDQLNYLYNQSNTENTLVLFNSPQTLFYSNGVISNPYNVMYYGVWGKNRVAELLPVNYQPVQDINSAPTDQSSRNIIDKLENFTTSHNLEKVYLHLDKPYYATGDTIYFKAYVTLGERRQLSALSGILHVELINTANKIAQGIKLQLVNGVGWGDFTLPDSLPAGNYRIRAYTRRMLNEGDFFEQTIPVGSVHAQKVPESSTAKIAIGKPDLQFFPESGQLIAGLPAKVAFKSIGANGLGLNVKGSVSDNSGKLVARFVSVHLGMGYFEFEPEEGKMYKANTTFADGTENTIDLPAPISKGISLSVNNDSLPKAEVKIKANPAYFNENKGKNFTLLIYSGGIATTVSVKLDSATICLDILKRHLQTGIATITLFSSSDEPLCERLFFVQNYDQLSLNLSTDKESYTTRGKVSIKLNAKTRADSAASGHFSVSVIDERKVLPNENEENTILSHLLLTSDLKGNIEQPNYYFTNINDEKLKELDLVMLTHGYCRFEWKQVLESNEQPLAYQPEKGLEITGNAKNLLGKPLAKAMVALLPVQSKQVFSTIADDKGNFSFGDLVFFDSTRFILQATNAKGKMYTKLSYSSDLHLPVVPPVQYNSNANTIISTAYLENNEKQQEELNKLGLGKGRMLKEVKIHEVRIDDKYETQSLAGAGHADQVIHSKDIGYGPSLASVLQGKLRGISFSNIGIPGRPQAPFLRGLSNGPMLVMVDGSELLNSDLSIVNPNDVETVEVLKYASASIYGVEGGAGVLVITTKRGSGTDAKDIASVGILPLTVQGYHKIREFYSPRYESDVVNNHPDLRSTIYWKPELVTGKDGSASFDYYNADGSGTYRVVIEGIDEKGNIGRQVYRYKVD